MPRETLERWRRHARIVIDNPALFTRSQTMLAIRFVKIWGWGQ